ncbi:hypothetical protein VE03_09100 [Pseudogymnoascus sp. 23342-1-I1]|nr:hypothetical protein VE03_09100 [Pseudogymnoascus sp. 23342-1-I1]
MSYDDVAWEKSDEVFDAWKHKLYRNDVLQAIGIFVQKHRGGVAIKICNPLRGSFNVCIQVEFLDGGSAMIRIPCPGVVMFPEEKENTSIPLPLILYYEMADECPYNLGPFIIMEYVKHAYDLTELFKEQDSTGDTMAIDPNITDEKLSCFYEQMADILLELSKCSFPEIGSLVEAKEFEYSVLERAMTLNTNELVQLGNFPPYQLYSQTFDSSASYLRALSDTHITHLSTQHNDAIESAEDCRRRYIPRHLFCKLATEHRLIGGDDKFFKLFCDDLGPHNVLVDAEFKVVTWLLIQMPERWPKGLDNWAVNYEKRLQLFLRCLEAREQVASEEGRATKEESLSSQMRQNWENEDFWVHYAARKSWAVDSIYWSKIDEFFFGPRDSFGGRLALLDEGVREGIDAFVRRKIEEQGSRVLIDWDEDGVASIGNQATSTKVYPLAD